jgi:uncharacterized protein YfaT (DUF1175 family)
MRTPIRCLLALTLALASGVGRPALAQRSATAPTTMPAASLDAAQSRVFRSWFVRIVNEQLRQGPTPRWVQRDCAGLVRFAVHEAFARHDARWLRANGIDPRDLPPALALAPAQQALGQGWTTVHGTRSAFVTALALVQANSRFVSRDINQALPVDLLFYDQGDDQHLMVWMGGYVAYHTGTVTPRDNGLRGVPVDQLLAWPDPRWQPVPDNPNFVGVFRLSFLTP